MAAAMLPDDVWEYVFSFVEGDVDRNSISLVCREWYGIERLSRRRIFVKNCHAVSPEMVLRRFPELTAVRIEWKPPFTDFIPMPIYRENAASLWVGALVGACPQLEELRFKGMVVTDDCLELIGRSFRNFKLLSLNYCGEFSTAGLASFGKNCRNLGELFLEHNLVNDNCSDWLNHFPIVFNIFEIY